MTGNATVKNFFIDRHSNTIINKIELLKSNEIYEIHRAGSYNAARYLDVVQVSFEITISYAFWLLAVV